MTAPSHNASPQRSHLPRSVARARLVMGIVAVILVAQTSAVVASHVGAAFSGVTLVFSQDEMNKLWGSGQAPMAGEPGIGPAPMQGELATDAESPPAGATGGGAQYVDLVGVALVLASAIVAAIGVLWLPSRSRWSVPAGLAGMTVVTGAAAFPGLIGLWAMDFYRLGVGDVAAFFVVSAVLVAMALLAAASIWRHRATLGPISA